MIKSLTQKDFLYIIFFLISCSVINSSLSKTILKYFSLSSSVSSKPGDNGIRINPFSHPSGAVCLLVIEVKFAIS